jgi:uncharacterized protein (DUF1778 family)
MEPVTTSRRLPVRVPPHIRRRAEQAAELRGLSLNSLIVYAVAQVSDQIIQEEHLIRLTEEGTRRFWQMIETPSEPNAGLAEAVKTHQSIPRA